MTYVIRINRQIYGGSIVSRLAVDESTWRARVFATKADAQRALDALLAQPYHLTEDERAYPEYSIARKDRLPFELRQLL